MLWETSVKERMSYREFEPADLVFKLQGDSQLDSEDNEVSSRASKKN